jgi:acyl-CoA synthetase (AMP-forming)/AMP-acid ligase II
MAMGSLLDDPQVLADGFAGRPLPDRLSFIGDGDCQELAPLQVGEVMVTHGYFDHYRNKPDKTAESKRGGVLHTGDLGICNADGYVKVLGRLSEADSAHRRGGFLRQVEDTYYEHDDVQHAVVVEGRDGAIEGFVELRTGKTPGSIALHEFVSARVPVGLIPARTTILDKMPRTFSGKADRLTLSKRAGA